jgi:hypothetical protein
MAIRQMQMSGTMVEHKLSLAALYRGLGPRTSQQSWRRPTWERATSISHKRQEEEMSHHHYIKQHTQPIDSKAICHEAVTRLTCRR